MRRGCAFGAGVAALVAAGAQAQPAPAPPPAPPPPPAQQIEITGGRESDTEERRRSTAAKIVIGRDEIDKFGDSTLGEVLRRLPGVTTPGPPGRGGPPRMRGLGNGYTQFLIDGQRVPPGFSFESLTPDQIERIEILRAPTAETGARAIAGTINIVTREGYRRRINDLRLSLAYENGAWTPGLNWTRNDSDGALTYNVSLGGFANHRRSSGATETVQTDLATGSVVESNLETSSSTEARKGLNLTGRLQWRLGEGGDSLLLTPNLFHNESHADRRFDLVQSVRPPTGGLDYDFGNSTSDGSFTTGRLNALWRQRVAGDLRMEVNGGIGGFDAANDSLRVEYQAGASAPQRTLAETTRTRERSALLNAKFLQLLGAADAAPGAEHSLVGGVELESVRRRESRTTVDNGVVQLPQFGTTLEASSLRSAAYVQDEWSLAPNWTLQAGLRWEGITTQGEGEAGDRPTNRSSVATPLVHAVWKPDPKGRDQVRISLTRSYRAPALSQLIARPTLSPKYPASGENTETSPDRAGNPELRPELATGIDVAIERYLAGGGLLSANVFRRSLSDLIRNVLAQETVSWSPAKRWVQRPQNVGDAMTEGVELEAKFGLDQVVDGAPRVELRANVSVYDSKVYSVPGPDNRLDQQARLTGNLGADYRLRATPLSLGGNLNWVPAYATQVSEEQRTTTGSKRVFDLYGLWTFDPAAALRLTASNLAPRDYESSNTITTATSAETARAFGPSYVNWQVRLEFKL